MHAFLTSVIPDFPVSPDVLHLYPEKSLGIDEVREIQHFLSRKPLASKANTVIVHDAEKLTLPAQNALLKILEEPPGNSLIYLITSQPNLLLPTIHSRVQFQDSVAALSADQDLSNSAAEIVRKIMQTGSVGERISILEAENFTRESALAFLNRLEQTLHQSVKPQNKTPLPDPEKIFVLLDRTRKYLKSNVNVNLCMDHFALDLPQSAD